LLHGRGEIIVFADDDVRAFPSWLASIEDCFRDSTVGLAGGKCLPDFETAPPEWFDSLWASVMGGRAIGAFSLIDLGEVMRDIPHHLIWGCNFAVRREVALGLGGFNPDAFPESMQKYRGDGETGLARRIAAHGLRAVYHPLASVYHYVSSRRMTLDYLYSRAFAQGISDSYTATRRRRSAFPKYMRALVTARAARIVAALGIRAGDRGSAARVRSAMSTGYVAGLHYHQSELRTDRHLREWVLRESYLDNEPPRID
jgi:GT2 family glycosyltransferase